MSIEQALYALIKNTAAISALVVDRIFPLLAPQGTHAPFVVYQRISGVRWRSIDGPSGKAQPRFQIDAYAESYAAAHALADAIRQVLDGYRGMVGTMRIGGITLETDQDMLEQDIDPPLFRVSMDFMITHDE